MIPEDKAAARKRARAGRGAVPAAERAAAGAKAARHFMATIPLSPGAVVSAYWPLGDELDSRPLIQALLDAGQRIALPVVQGAGRPLCFRRWRHGDAMATSSFGVSEPLQSAAEVRPKIVIAPLLAYNGEGYRLGYGGGYYDRTLRALRQGVPGLLAVGLGFAAQEMPALPYDGHDEPLDWLVNENGARRFPRRNHSVP